MTKATITLEGGTFHLNNAFAGHLSGVSGKHKVEKVSDNKHVITANTESEVRTVVKRTMQSYHGMLSRRWKPYAENRSDGRTETLDLPKVTITYDC